MIHVFIGTKAQFIKMAPVMQELERRRIAYNFIDAGQHGGLTSDLIQQFELRAPDVLLRSERANIVGLGEAVAWAAKNIARAAFRSRQAFKELFRSEGGICLIHGDTLTTLLSLFYARRCGIKVAHIEAGLRSHDLFNPFPEEIIRLVAMRYSDLLFAPSDWAAENLRQMGCAWKAVKVGGNTVADAVRYARENINGKKQQNKPRNRCVLRKNRYIFSPRQHPQHDKNSGPSGKRHLSPPVFRTRGEQPRRCSRQYRSPTSLRMSLALFRRWTWMTWMQGLARAGTSSPRKRLGT